MPMRACMYIAECQLHWGSAAYIWTLGAQLEASHLLPHLTLPQAQPGCLLTPPGALPGSQGLCLQANSTLLLRLWHSVGLTLQ